RSAATMKHAARPPARARAAAAAKRASGSQCSTRHSLAMPRAALLLPANQPDLHRCGVGLVPALRAVAAELQRCEVRRVGADGADHDLVAVAVGGCRVGGHDAEARGRTCYPGRTGIALVTLVAFGACVAAIALRARIAFGSCIALRAGITFRTGIALVTLRAG